MSLELVTGRSGTGHISSADVGALLASAFGTGSYVLGDRPTVAMRDANTCVIGAAELMVQGRHVRIQDGESVTVESGVEGYYRRDLIVLRYEYDSSTRVETMALRAVTGTASDTSAGAADPTTDYQSSSILGGSAVVDVPVVRVTLSGLTPTAVWLLGPMPGIDDLYGVAGRTRNDITPLVRDGTLSEAVRANDLAARGLKVGDYFTGKSGYTYHLADMDTFYGGYNSYAVVAQHHAGIVVDTHTDDKWNDAADTSNGYVSSKLHSLLVNTHLPVIRSDIADLTGGDAADHLIAHSKLYSTKVQNGVSSSWAWSSGQYISALTEMQVYGGTVWSSSGYDTGEASRQLGVFAKFDPNLLFGNAAVWLRDVNSATGAAFLNCYGRAYDGTADNQLRVAGLILFH